MDLFGQSNRLEVQKYRPSFPYWSVAAKSFMGESTNSYPNNRLWGKVVISGTPGTMGQWELWDSGNYGTVHVNDFNIFPYFWKDDFK